MSGEEQFPKFETLTLECIPDRLECFNQLSRSVDPKVTSLHFYTEDVKFKSVLLQPEKHVSNFLPYKSLITPDVSIGSGMPKWQRMQKTFLSRSVGAYFSSRQFEVIPSLRWIEVSDLDFVCQGIPKGSVFAVGALGNFRNKQLRTVFEAGLVEAVNRLNPVAVLIYGSIRPEFQINIEQKTQIFIYPTPMSVKNSKYTTGLRQNLFYEDCHQGSEIAVDGN